MKLTEIEPSSTQRVLVFGAPKTGKTELVGKLSEKYNLLWFDLENGYSTLLKLPQAYKERIEIISLPDTKAYPIAIETMLKVLTGSKVSICNAHGKVNCQICKKTNEPATDVELNALSNDTIVVIDSLTQLSNSAMSHITKAQPEGDLYQATFHDYRSQGNTLDRALSYIQQASYNVVCISHEIETEMEDGKNKLVPVAGTRNFSRNTAKYFDHVVYCEVKNKEHRFFSGTTSSSTVLTGSRLDIAIEKDKESSLLQIFDFNKKESKDGYISANTILVDNSVGNKPVVIAPSIQEVPTPAQTSVSNLRALLLKKGA